MKAKPFGLAVALSLLWTIHAGAQAHPNIAKGSMGGGGFGTADIDSVTPFNGSLSIQLPIGQVYPVNAGLSYRLALTYNSQVWEHETDDTGTVAIPARASNAGLGWSLHLGRLNPPRIDFNAGSPDFNRNTYMAPDGSLHTFYPTLHEGESAVSGVEYTRDGSYLRLKTASLQIELPDGTIHTFSSLTNGYLTRIQDRFGNFVQVDYLDCTPFCNAVSPSTAHRWQITDTQGRVHRIDLRDTGEFYQSRVITRVDLQAFGGSRAIYKFLYNDSTDDNSTTGTPVGLTGCDGLGGSNHVVWFLTKLVLPDGSLFDIPKSAYFAFNVPGDFSIPCKTGLINRLRLPTLGFIEWDYRLYRFPSASTTRNIWQKSTGVEKRRLRDAFSGLLGEWTYTTALSGGTTAHEKLLTNSVIDPLGNRVTRYFSVCVTNCTHPDGPYEYGLPVGRDSGSDGTGRVLSAQILDPAGTPLRTTYVRFEHDAPSASTLVQERSRLNQRMASQRTQFNDDPAGTFADESFSNFDGLGHYRSLTRGGNLSSSGYANFTNFNPAQGTYGQAGYVPFPASSPWLVNLFNYHWVSDGTQVRIRFLCVDPQTGFLSGRRTLVSGDGSLRTNDLVEVFTQAAGNVTSERYYGGDTQPVSTDGTQGSICVMASVARGPGGAILTPMYEYSHQYSFGIRSRTSATVGTTLNLLDLTIDGSTGLASASRDAAGKQVTFSYDTLGRLTTVDPADDLLTVSSYCTATSVPACSASVRAQTLVSRRATAGGADVTATRNRFDDWGRLISQEERMPPSGAFSARTTTYNALGWRIFVSEQGSSFGTSFLNFDAFGRPRTIQPPDGAAHNVTLSYQGIRQVSRMVRVATSTSGETNATTTEVYDRYGRLSEVTEPNGVKTRYGYDGANHLRAVCQGATGAGTATCGQRRIFNYDNRDFLLSEQHPEKGASGNGIVSYFNYDARGHALRTVDGPNDLTYTFDRAERLTQVRETGGAQQRVLKTFSYAPQNVTDAFGATDWRKGKLVTASRLNYVAIEGTPYTVEVRENYAYTGLEGRASSRETQFFINGSNTDIFTQGFTYTGLGEVASLAYPNRCPTCGGSMGRTVSFVYTNGFLTGVPGFASLSYHNNGLLNQVAHTNGVTFTQANDPNSIMRPASMTAAKTTVTPNQTLWNTGAYGYDGAGNVEAIGTQTFVYDRLSRLIQGNLSGNSQSYTYDDFGNIQSITTGASLVNTPTSSATNRLTSGSYDGAGNLRFWSNNTYEYDPFNLMWRFASGGDEWFYLYTADDERLLTYQLNGNEVNLWTLRDLEGKVLRQYTYHRITSTWQLDADYVYRDGVLLANAASATSFDVDHLGTPRLITDAAGNQVGFHTYYPFGKELTALQEGERMKFTGHERDLANLAGDGDDLDYMHARHYSPLIGRFLSTDPLGGDAGQPQSWNLYSYVVNRPLTFTDPAGLWVAMRVFPPVGMTLTDLGGGYYGATITVFSNGSSVTVTQQPSAGNSFSIRHPTGGFPVVGTEEFAREVLGRAYRLSEPPVRWIGIYLEVFAVVVTGFGEIEAFQLGREIMIGKNLRLARWGNRTGHRYGRFSHYHRRGRLGADGRPLPGQGMGRHRPLEPPAPGQPWWTRF